MVFIGTGREIGFDFFIKKVRKYLQIQEKALPLQSG